MRQGPPSEARRRPKDDKFAGLKRRVMLLSRLDGGLVRLHEGLFLVQARGVRSPAAIVSRLRSHGMLDRATLEHCLRLESPLLEVDARAVAAAHRDMRVLAQRPALDLAREHHRALARFGTIDEAWVRAKQTRIEHVSGRLEAYSTHGRDPARWFDGVVELVCALRGELEAARLADAGARVDARGPERRTEAHRRIAALVASMVSGEPAVDPDLTELAERLDAARELAGRARRRRVLDVLRRAIAWSSAPAALVEALGTQTVDHTFASRVEDAGRAMAALLPVVRDPSVRDKTLEFLATLGLAFVIGEHGVPIPDEDEAPLLLRNIAEILDLAASKVPLARAMALAKIPMKGPTRQTIARWVNEGLELELIAEAAEKKHIENLAQVPDVRAARAYATWATRLSAHYDAQGIRFSLPPELFTNLPRNEDLAILAMCLMEQVDPKTDDPKPANADAKPAADPIAVLDATLGLFQKLPAKARGLLGSLRGTDVGAGRILDADFAAWLGDDVLLDRCVHVARLAGERALSSAVREDFEHAARARGERVHLEALAVRSAPQQGRLDALVRKERTLAGSPLGRTRRRVAQRIEQLMPTAYRRELDVTFREILREAWGIDVPSMTPAWRDAVRFWLVVDDNRALLGRLLKEAAKRPGRSVTEAFAKNAAWLDQASERMDIGAWLVPRLHVVKTESGPFTLSLEEDPLEILRMGIPFGTCLALDSGCNAASTVLNAIEANKRVLYVRNESGRVVARKLLAISKDLQMIGYNLYVAVRGNAEVAIRAAVLETCRAIARDAGIALASTGEPAQLHEGFWYDDGTVPFEEDRAVADYCASLGLAPTPTWYEDLGAEAQGWRAQEAGDAASAMAHMSAYYDGPATRVLGAWVIDRIGLRAAERGAASNAALFDALARRLTNDGEYGFLRVLDVAARMPEQTTKRRLAPLLARFPPSPKIAVALVDLALRQAKHAERTTQHSAASLTLYELVTMFDDVAGALDLLDTIEPVWTNLAHVHPNWDKSVTSAVERAANVTEAIFARAPDPDVVVATLMSRHRGALAHRACVRIAARHVLRDGDRALMRFATLRPQLAASPDGVAAFVRQARIERMTAAVVRSAPARFIAAIRDEAPFEALRDLLVSCKNLESLLPALEKPVEIEKWTPGPWELAWRRRQRDDALGEALLARATIASGTATRGMELLAFLADLRRLGVLEREAKTRRWTREPIAVPRALVHANPRACHRTAASLERQVGAERRGRVDEAVVAAPHADAAYVDLARRALEADEADDASDDAKRSAAREIVVLAPAETAPGYAVVDWRRLLERAASNGDAETARRILTEKFSSRPLTPRLVVDAWQLEGARDALVGALVRGHGTDWSARVWAAEREASARGLDVEGLLEQVAVALAVTTDRDDALEVETLDQLRSVVGAIVRKAPADDVVKTYAFAEDALTAATFVRAIRREDADRRAGLREAAKTTSADFDEDRGKALKAWLEEARVENASPGDRATLPCLRTEDRSSIERG